MALNVESLLKPISEDQPAGDDLSYDPERQQIEHAFETGEYGAPDADAEAEIDWRPTIRSIEQLFGRTKDVWLATYLCRAGARSGSLETIEVGAEVLAGLFEGFWETVHPQLDELGLPGRKAPCDSLASRKDFLGPLERVVLVAHQRFGSFTGVDFERFRTGAEAEAGYRDFRLALEDLGDEVLVEASERLNRIEAALKRADRVFTEAANGEPSPNFSATYAALATLRQALNSFMMAPSPSDDMDSASEESSSPGGAKGGGGGRLSGSVESREDVARVLELVMDYYRRHEPGHPIQPMMRRAIEWISLDFMELLSEIAPDAVSEASRVLNKRVRSEY